MRKKTMFLMPVAAMLLASCSNDEVVETNTGTPIDFRIGMATRAIETTVTNLPSIYVTAFNDDGGNSFFDEFKKKDVTAEYRSEQKHYWLGDGKTMQFYAYAPSKEELGVTPDITPTSQKLDDFVPASQASAQKDFITAYATGTEAANGSTGVPLHFEHRLSQIEVRAKNSNTNYVYKVKGVRISEIKSKGTFDFKVKTWDLKQENANYWATYDTPVTLGGEMKSIMDKESSTTNSNVMILPQTLTAWDKSENNTNKGAYLAILVNIETRDGGIVFPAAKGQYSYVSVPISQTWNAGKKYVYQLDFSNGGGLVSPPVNPTDGTDEGSGDGWTPGEPVLGQEIFFTVEVTNWVEEVKPIDMPNSN